MSDRPNNEAPEKLPVVRPERKHALLLVLIAVVGLLAASLLVGLILPRSASRLHQLLAMDVFYYLPFMVLPVALVMRKRGSLGALRPNPIAPGDVFLIIPLALLGVLAVNYIITLWAIPLQKLGLDVILLGVSLYGLYTFNGQKDILAARVQEGASLDPLLFLSSSM